MYIHLALGYDCWMPYWTKNDIYMIWQCSFEVVAVRTDGLHLPDHSLTVVPDVCVCVCRIIIIVIIIIIIILRRMMIPHSPPHDVFYSFFSWPFGPCCRIFDGMCHRRRRHDGRG